MNQPSPARGNDKQQRPRWHLPGCDRSCGQLAAWLLLCSAVVLLGLTWHTSLATALWVTGGLALSAVSTLGVVAIVRRRTQAAAPEHVAKATQQSPDVDPAAPADRPGAHRPPDGSPKPGSLAGKRVLLLSNDHSDQHGIRRHLDSWGAETRVCKSSVRAFAAVIEGEQNQTPFHALIVDQGQFDMDSRQFAISLRSDPELQALYLIHIGMPALTSLVKQFYSLGYNQLLRKPLDKTLLFAALHGITPQPPGEEHQVVQLLGHYTGRGQCRPLRVLLAESDPREQQRFRVTLQRAGHQVFLVDDGAQALNAIDSQPFDLAVVSYQLQEINGLEAFKLYRFTRLNEEWIPFILLLDSRAANEAQACRDAGVEAILARPFTSRQLLDQLELVAQRTVRHPTGEQGKNVSTIYGSSQAMVIDGLTLDGQRLEELEQLGKGREFLAELLRNFDQECQQFTRQVEEAIEQERGQQLRDIGHTIKDGAGSLGMLDLYHIGVKFTRLPADRLPDNADRLLSELRECCQASYLALQKYLSQRDAFLES